jgi:hypothetical protein
VLEKLLRRCPWVDRVIPQGAPLPDFAYEVPMLSLPGIFHTMLETVPNEVPYLSAEPERVARWGAELASIDGIKIGIAWQGSKTYQGDAHRSVPLREFAPLAAVPGVRLVSLQKGYGAEQLVEVANAWNVIDFGARLDADGAFLDTAAIMGHLDLQDFGERFVELARSVYRHNDERADLKRQINRLLGSRIAEEKA